MKQESISPITLFHRDLPESFIEAKISPIDHSVILLNSSTKMNAYSCEGDKVWDLEIPFEAATFSISPDGETVAVLGNGIIGVFDVKSRELKHFNVNGKITKVDFHRSQIVLGGFDRRIYFFAISGTRIKTLEFNFMIRDFKMVPELDRIMLYNEHLRLVCTDTNGEVLWETDSVRVVGPMETTRKGKNNYCLMEPEGIVQFSVPDQLFFNVRHEPPVKWYSASRDGRFLLTYNSGRELVLYNKGNKALWKKKCDHSMKFLKISHDGDYFLTVDSENVFSLYSLISDGRERGDFLEIQKEKENVREKQAAWSKKPGFTGRAVRKLAKLSVSSQGNRVGVIGLDGGVYFYDQQGNWLFDMKFPVIVEEICFSQAGNHVSIYGEKRVAYIDLTAKKSTMVFLEYGYRGKPVFNFPHERVFLISNDEKLLVLDLKGKLVAERQLPKHFEKGVTCRELGVILYNEEEFSGFSDEGKKLFTYEMKEKINNILYYEGKLLVTTKTGALLRFDLITMKGQKKRVCKEKKALTLISAEPLLITDGDTNLYLLQNDLSVEKTLPFRSPDSHFFFSNSELLEIVIKRSGFSCKNEQHTIWRYKSDERIRESVLSPNGLFFLKEESLGFIPLADETEVNKDYSHFLEI